MNSIPVQVTGTVGYLLIHSVDSNKKPSDWVGTLCRWTRAHLGPPAVTRLSVSQSLVVKTQDCTPEKQIRSIICSTYTSHILEPLNSWFLQLFDLLLDHKLKGLVVDEPWQFSSTVSLLILLHFFFKPLVNCNRQTILCFRVPLLDSCGPTKENDYGGHVHLSPEQSSWLSHFQNCLLRVVKTLSLSPHLSSSPAVRLMTS